VAKVRVAVWGTVGKSVLIDTGLDTRVATLEAAITRIGAGGVTAHNQLTGLPNGDDHPQYAMNAAAETISAPWNFAAIPLIEGTLLDEYIQDTIGLELRNSESIYLEYSDYGGTDGKISAHLNNEYVEDLVGAMLTDSPTIDLTYGDVAGDISAAVKTDFPYVWSALHTFNAKILTDHIDIGEADAMVIGGVTVDAQVQNNSDTMAAYEAHTHSNIAGVPSAYYAARGRGTEAVPLIVQNGDYLMRLAAVGYDGVDYAFGGAIDFVVSATPGSNDMPTDIIFSTAADGSQTLVEHFRITAGGTGVFSGAVTGASFNAITGLANPSANVGLSAVNGSAATAMRSDGAPALDQGIAPTWTGLHTFTKNISAGETGKLLALNTTTARGGGAAYFDFNDPTGEKGFFGYGSSDDAFYVHNNMASQMLFGTNGTIFLTVSSGRDLGINCVSVAGTALRVQDDANNDTGIEFARASSTISYIQSYNRNLTQYTGLNLYANSFIFNDGDVGRDILNLDSTTFAFGNATDNPTYAFNGTGAATFGGRINTVLSATGGAGLRLPHGVAPSSPVDGDMWTTTAGLYVRINGATVGPLT
jgi:hypothetical protein